MVQTPRDSGRKNREIFQCLDHAETHKGALGASLGLHIAALAVLFLVPLLAPHTLNLNYRTVMLAPPAEQPKPPEPLQLRLPREALVPRPVTASSAPVIRPIAEPEPPPRQPEVREIRIVEAPPPPAAPPMPVNVTTPLPAPKLVVPDPPQPTVVTNVFSAAAPATGAAVTTKSAEAAGFDRSVQNPSTRTARPGSTAQSGFGDIQGSSGARRAAVRGTAGPLSGFDVAAEERPVTNARQPVEAAGFSAAEVAKPATSSSKRAVEPPMEKPVEILLKPRPDYTDEARKRRIEGEVLLRVLFTSSGQARVQEVLRGLGYGLDQNAKRAAEKIQFRPAQRSGQPVDSSAIVHIVFQLAY